ncbi:14017_t:CDS:2 [Funneliformis geosporum]|nr:14017_t:CDS:2 [Funneliformis geosporum]
MESLAQPRTRTSSCTHWKESIARNLTITASSPRITMQNFVK